MSDQKSWLSPRTVAIAAVLSAALSFLCLVGIVLMVFRGSPAGGAPEKAAADARAWLSPVSIEFVRTPLETDGQPRLDITLNYVNVGHEPARGVVVRMRSGTKPQDFSNGDLDDVYAGEDTMCDGLTPPDKGGIILPASARVYSQTDIMSNEALIEARKGVLVVQACIRYSTAGRTRTTMICEYVEPETDRPLEKRRMRFCADGNSAD